jgi:protein-L-isoaspartate(D-aspartate) O-methyltransferase
VKEHHLKILRRHMVEVIEIYVELAADELGKDRLDPRVMAAMTKVPRHLFVPPPLLPHAYENMPLPIGFDKTISQPFIVAVMTDLLEPRPGDVVLEIGTGLGYQAAILAELTRQVWTVEIIEELASAAELLLQRLGYTNIAIRVGDGAKGWAEKGPFDRIICTAAPELVPPPLIEQLKPGGRMVLPTGLEDQQKLTVVDRDARGRVSMRDLMAVRFSQLETVR